MDTIHDFSVVSAKMLYYSGLGALSTIVYV